MSRVARITAFGPELEPISVVVHEDELSMPMEEAISAMRPVPGGYVAVDEFESDHELVGATLEATQRGMDAREEESQAALLYHWNAGVLLRVAEGGVLTATLPAPLTVERIIDVFQQLAVHPNYRGQLVMGISQDERFVTMRNGDAKEVVDGGNAA